MINVQIFIYWLNTNGEYVIKLPALIIETKVSRKEIRQQQLNIDVFFYFHITNSPKIYENKVNV